MPEEWWIRMDKDIKGAIRFNEQGLQNEYDISKIFEGLLNTGEDHWNPSSGVAPSQSFAGEGSTNNAGDEDEADNANEEDGDPEEVTPSNGKGKKVIGNNNKKLSNLRPAVDIGFKGKWTKL